MLQVIIRKASANDVPAARQCISLAFTPFISRIGRTPAAMLLDLDTHTRDGHVWVAEHADAVAGVLVQYPTPTGFYIDVVAAVPHLQGQGVGRALLVFAEQEAKRLAFDSLYLCTNSKMVENQALYARVGYVEYERQQMAGYDRIFYRKPLPAMRHSPSGTSA